MGKRGRGKRPLRAAEDVLLCQGKGPVKRTQLHAFDLHGSDDIEYVVEEILAERSKYGEPQFLIKWEDLGPNSDTWEPLANLPGASDDFQAASEKLRAKYWKHFDVKMEGTKITHYRCKHCGPDGAAKEYCGNTSNLRAHLVTCHKNVVVDDILEEHEASSKDQPRRGSLAAILPQPSSEQRERIHRRIALWLVKKGRPLTLPERDTEFRAIFHEIFKDAYRPPTYQLVLDQVCALSAEGQIHVMSEIKTLLTEGILCSVSGDIWSEGGIAIFGVLVYYIDVEFNLKERLVSAIPFSAVRHTGYELEIATKVACAKIGIGEFDENEKVDTVVGSVHCTVSDNASNIVNGWNCFDGFECVVSLKSV
ncbi:hypothetical protein CYMTET_44832 [Cymbomonas tetramitiformis]|uniref:Chromo domain-containing protein n=1 Tax=Cymbomonas tetramitiformis TaxID=36881 RepID=A0AAE0BZF2_9CHLO|nr:hypothetical protein CYMTET_44832 [Cymbomonas tetramitiformis]